MTEIVSTKNKLTKTSTFIVRNISSFVYDIDKIAIFDIFNKELSQIMDKD